VSIVNRRNAILGWLTWMSYKRTAKRLAKRAAPSVESGRPNKSLLAVGSVAGTAAALTVWRKKHHSDAESD
jgi:hypothetical protein